MTVHPWPPCLSQERRNFSQALFQCHVQRPMLYLTTMANKVLITPSRHSQKASVCEACYSWNLN